MTQKKNKKVSVRFTESEYEEMKRHRGDKTTSAYLKGLIAKSKGEEIKETNNLLILLKEIAENVQAIKKRGER